MPAKPRRRADSSRQREAAARNLQKARQAHGKGHLTSRQLAARRRNLVIARADHRKGALTGAQLAADRANLAVAHAKAKTAPSAKLLAAEAKWIAKGEAAWKRGEAIYIARGRAAWLRAAHRHRLGSHSTHLGSLKASRRAPLGTRVHQGSLHQTLATPRLLGEPRKFSRRISPVGYGRTTKWERAHNHRFRKRLAPRRARRARIGNWRRSRRRVTPR